MIQEDGTARPKYPLSLSNHILHVTLIADRITCFDLRADPVVLPQVERWIKKHDVRNATPKCTEKPQCVSTCEITKAPIRFDA